MTKKPTKPDYALKSKALAFDEEYHAIDLMNCIRNFDYKLEYHLITWDEFMNSELRKKCTVDLHKLYLEFPDLVKECEKILRADWERTRRLKHKIQSMFDEYENVVFLTLTFRDSYLFNTTAEQRRRSIREFLKRICPDGIYCGNIDFGKINHREHYHALISCRVSKADIDYYNKNYGSIDFELVPNKITDRSRVAIYVAKLTNHAVKETTKRSHLIYSRRRGALS